MTEEGFIFSGFPSRWAPAVSAVLLAILSLAVAYLSISHRPLGAVAAGVGGMLLLGAAGRYLTRVGVLDFPLDRMSSVNLVARPASGEPRLWLVAHLDSKSQTIPMLLRVLSVGSFAILFTLLIVAALGIAAADPHSSLERTLSHLSHNLAVFAAIALLPLLLCFIGNKSPGALDNASGVAAVLMTAERVKSAGVGILLTSGEELGLAGARAFVRASTSPSTAINCDTIDSAGAFLVMRSGRPPSRLEPAIGRVAERLGLELRVRSMLPGVLADNIAFTDAGWESLTLSRGNLATLGRVHTSRDRADAFGGTGIAQAALMMTALVEELT